MKNEIQNLTENEYTELLNTAKAQINAARNAIAVQINSSANSTYWNLGKLLHEKKIEGGYGGNVINRLSVDLKQSFPDMGLSPRNLWNRDLLLNAIKMNSYALHKNELRDNNFSKTLPALQANQANSILKDSYNLGFLGITEPVAELELEKRIIEKIKIFMLELGKGFAYIGNQYRLEYNGKEYFVDLLFSNRKLNCKQTNCSIRL